ncbi:MAG: DNA replication and repair protein RecF [Cyclobacteriaceae bacterium]|nr:DNA replication and repair protein RecF [Cyclobacteriaceae bacterium]
MRLEKLHLVNFKNYTEAKVEFKGNVHCFLGKNGSGKTNLLEAVHYLSFTKGKFHSSDVASIRHGQDHFFLKGTFEKDKKHPEVACAFSTDQKKVMSEDGKEYSRFSEHIGKYPLVLVAPNDISLISESGDSRRKFFDTLLSQTDRVYLDNLIIYQAQLRQRNSLLKMFAERNAVDRDLIASYDEKMVVSGNILFKKRTDFVKSYHPLLSARYDFLSQLPEKSGIAYQSDLQEINFENELTSNLDRDVAAGRTTVGIHRDDFLFTLAGHELKRFGSQGQQKSFLIALKLAELDYLVAKNNSKPILLLDDIFDKLDDDRIHQLMKLVTGGSFGQIFITDARPGRSLEVLKEAGVKSQNFRVEEGSISEIRNK